MLQMVQCLKHCPCTPAMLSSKPEGGPAVSYGLGQQVENNPLKQQAVPAKQKWYPSHLLAVFGWM